MNILTIETSCDETAIAIGEIKNDKVKVISQIVSSQVKLHSKWGGVVPNLAAREHLKNLIPCMKAVCKEAGFKNPDEASKFIDVIGVTQGPGLVPSLLMGVSFAKSLSYIWQKPLVPVNHLEGHIYTPWVDKLSFKQKPFPLLALVVSGGHTMLISIKDYLNYKVIGETLDDAAGEAFDKVARILGLGYPGGPVLSKTARKGKPDFEFPLPLKNRAGYDFSFSGLKTAVLYKALDMSGTKLSKSSPKPDLNIPLYSKQKADIARAFEDVVVESLVGKIRKVLREKNYKGVLIGGGVAANVPLRRRFKDLQKEFPKVQTFLPPVSLTGDNAVMLLPAVYLKWKENKGKGYDKTWQNLEAEPNLKLK